MYVATHYYHHQHRIPASARLISTEIDTPWQMSSYKYYSDSVSWSGSSDSEYAVREVHFILFIFYDARFTFFFYERRVCCSYFYCYTNYKNRLQSYTWSYCCHLCCILAFEATISTSTVCNYVLQLYRILLWLFVPEYLILRFQSFKRNLSLKCSCDNITMYATF